MRFSEAFNVTRTDKDDWFDPHLTVDTKLFIDPLLMLKAGGVWEEAHGKLIDFFTHCYGLVASSESPESSSAKAASSLLTFPEPQEFCLGYTRSGTRGAGSGDGYAREICDGIAVAIVSGLDEPEHIEEIGILSEGIGADRISDITANVLKGHFIKYTQEICKRHNIPLKLVKVRNTRVDLKANRWIDDADFLPVIPKTEQPIILVPQRILNTLTILNAKDWFDSPSNKELRNTLNLQIGKSVPKSKIVELVRLHPEQLRKWAREQTSRPDLKGYDFASDPRGYMHWDSNGRQYALAHPLPERTVENEKDLYGLLDEIVEQFKHYIEKQGWRQLWKDDGKEKREEAVQLAFLGMAKPYLRLFDIETDREVDLGRGPIDLKISKGTSVKVLIEVKQLKNGKFWQRLDNQLSSNMESDNVTHAWLIAVQYKDTKTVVERKKQLPEEVIELSHELGKKVRYTVIDARPRESE